MARLAIIVPISIFLIFLLLFNAFGSVKSALLILLQHPVSPWSAGSSALLLTSIPLSVSAAIGFIALFGQAVLNGVVIVSYFNTLRAQGMDAERRGRRRLARALPHGIDDGAARDAGPAADGALARHRLGGAEAARRSSSSAAESRRHFLTLVVLPALYALMERRSSEAEPPVEAERPLW